MSADRPPDREVRICIEYQGQQRPLVWLSLRTEENKENGKTLYPISIGFSGTFLASQLLPPRSGPYSKEDAIHLGEKYKKTSLTDPHFTYHPPNYYHLVANKHKEEIAAGLVWAENAQGPCGGAEGVDFWVRILSAPVSSLPIMRMPTGKSVEIYNLLNPDRDCSVGLYFDFVREPAGNRKVFKFVRWGNILLRIHARIEPAQDATLGYFCA